VACKLEVLAPVSIFARRPATPKSGSATHSRRPTTVKWSKVFKCAQPVRNLLAPQAAEFAVFTQNNG
jgi:hypothetical protein